MVSDAAFNALAFGLPKQEEARSPRKSEVAQISRLAFPDANSLNPHELFGLTAFAIVCIILTLLLDLNAVSTVLVLAACSIVVAAIYRYLLNNSNQMALLSACMLLAKVEREFELLADFIQSSLLPIEQLMDTGKSTTITPLPADKQRHYFMLVQIRSALSDMGRKIHECLDDPEMEKLENCFNFAKKEIVLHQSALAQSRTVVPLDTIEDFTFALLDDLDPQAIGESFLSQNRA